MFNGNITTSAHGNKFYLQDTFIIEQPRLLRLRFIEYFILRLCPGTKSNASDIGYKNRFRNEIPGLLVEF